MMQKSSNSLSRIQRKISATQIILVVSLTIILAIIGIVTNIKFEKDKTDRNLQNISETIATSPSFMENDIQNGTAQDQVNLMRYLDSLKKSLYDVDVISIVNKNNQRFYHTNHSLIGTQYNGEQPDFSPVEKTFYIVNTNGPSGAQRRAYSALYSETGEYLGFIMVIILTEHVNENITQIITTYAILAFVAIVIELFITSRISKSIKNSLLGYEPDTISAMYLVRDNILESLKEGVIAVDKNGTILFTNNSAVKMLDKSSTATEFIGKNIEQIKNGNVIKTVLNGTEKEFGIQGQRMDGTDVIIDRIPIKHEEDPIDTICILHDRAEYTKLMEDLAGTRYLVDSMRANNHDFTNKLHVILGLIQMEMYDQATSYIENITMVQRASISKIMNCISEPALAALLIGKTARAAELNVKFTLRDGSHFSNTDMHIPTEVLITVIGNLIENAFESMNAKEPNPSNPNELIIGLFSKEDSILITVDDTGLGISEENKQRIFENGFSTKGENRGTGLYQVKTMVENLGGLITVDSQENVGTSFFVYFSKGKKEN
ncbi:MAG: sensor histidine kinase [Clostridia bacterium]|nr:sensor histidine kinase [Clostridia bacterium]